MAHLAALVGGLRGVVARRADGPRRGLAGGLAAGDHVLPGRVLAVRLRRGPGGLPRAPEVPRRVRRRRGSSSRPSSRRPWRRSGSCSSSAGAGGRSRPGRPSALALAVLATAVLGTGIWGDYQRFLCQYLSTFDELSVRPSVMWNLRGTLTLLIGPDRAAEQAALINGVGLRRAGPGPAGRGLDLARPLVADDPLVRPAIRAHDRHRPADQPASQPARRLAAGPRRRHRLPGAPRKPVRRLGRPGAGARAVRHPPQRHQRQRRRRAARSGSPWC